MRCSWIAASLLAVLPVFGCRTTTAETSESSGQAQPTRAPEPAQPDAALPPPPVEPAILPLDLKGRDEKRALRELGAVPAWTAVIRRGEYLGRRNRRGVVHGRVGKPMDGHDWLIDETEGAGALGIRLVHDRAIELEPGQRLAIWGSWHVDEERRWYWKAERMTGLAPAASRDAPEIESEPGHEIKTIDSPPQGSQPVSKCTSGPADIVFEVTRIPEDPADGWEISDRSDWKPVARLYLPGEDAAYGAQDYRTPGEHWRLERNVRYVVRVKRFLPSKAGELVNMTALGAPRRLAGK